MLSLRRIEASVSVSQWDFWYPGHEAQSENSVGRAREGKKKNKDRLEELGGSFWERKLEETERRER